VAHGSRISLVRRPASARAATAIERASGGEGQPRVGEGRVHEGRQGVLLALRNTGCPGTAVFQSRVVAGYALLLFDAGGGETAGDTVVNIVRRRLRVVDGGGGVLYTAQRFASQGVIRTPDDAKGYVEAKRAAGAGLRECCGSNVQCLRCIIDLLMSLNLAGNPTWMEEARAADGVCDNFCVDITKMNWDLSIYACKG